MREMRRRENKPLYLHLKHSWDSSSPQKWTAASHWCNKGYDFPFRGWEVRQPPGVRRLSSGSEAPRIILFVFLSYSLLPSLSPQKLRLTVLLGHFLLIGVNAESNCAHMG